MPNPQQDCYKIDKNLQTAGEEHSWQCCPYPGLSQSRLDSQKGAPTSIAQISSLPQAFFATSSLLLSEFFGLLFSPIWLGSFASSPFICQGLQHLQTRILISVYISTGIEALHLYSLFLYISIPSRLTCTTFTFLMARFRSCPHPIPSYPVTSNFYSSIPSLKIPGLYIQLLYMDETCSLYTRPISACALSKS